MTEGIDLSAYETGQTQENLDEAEAFVADLYERLALQGFDLIPFENAREEMGSLRAAWAPSMEYLIDAMLTPRGFWGHKIGLVSNNATHIYD